MKKNFFLIALIFLIFSTTSCTGYKPIFNSSSFKFKIVDSTLEGDLRLGRQLNSKFLSATSLNKNNQEMTSVEIIINIEKEKVASVKNITGKIIEYKIILNTNIILNDHLNSKELLNQTFNYVSGYNVQDQHSETVKLENKILKDLIDKTYQDSIIKISEFFN
jgi:hypothetical protein